MSRFASSFEPIASMTAAGGPTKMSPAASHGRSERGVLGQEAVPGVHGVGAGSLRRVDDQVAAQVGVGRRAAGKPHRLVGHRHERRAGVGVGEHGDGRGCRARGRSA